MKPSVSFLISFLCIFLFSCKKATSDLFVEARRQVEKQQYEKAIKKYTTILERNEKLQLAYYNRGFCYYNLGKYEQALADYNHLVELQKPGNGKFIFTLENNTPFASEEAKYQVTYAEALYLRAQAYFALGKYSASFDDFEYLTEAGYEEESNCYLWEGYILIHRGDTTKACVCFSNAQKLANRDEIAVEAGKNLASYCH